MTTSNEGKGLIKQYEGLRLQAYRCAAGMPTIGWGHTKGVMMGQTITEELAEDLLIEDIGPIERTLNALGVNFRQEQFDALVSWTFNLGLGNLNTSTMLRLVKAGAQDEQVTDQMVRWTNAKGKPLPGLMRRRAAEANMFLGYERYVYNEKNGRIVKV